MKKYTVWLALATFAFACEDWKSSGPDWLRDAYPATCSAADSGAARADGTLQVAASDRIAGTWAARVVQKGTIAIPSVCDACVLTLTDLALAEVPADGGGILWRFCDQPMVVDTTPADPNDPPDPSAPRSVVPPALREAGVRAWTPFESPATNRFPAHRVLWLWGLRDLPDPAADPLPDSPDAPGVFDQDHDGHPGVTIQVESPLQGERYMVRRAVWNLSEAALSADGLTASGTLTFQVEEKAVGADNPLLTIVAPITPLNDGNTFDLRRVPADFTCADLVARFQSLFEPRP